MSNRFCILSFYRSVRSSSPSEASDRYRNGEPGTPSDSFSLHHTNFLSSHTNLRSPPPHPPPRYPAHPVDLHSPSDGPLNLSISNSSNGDRGSGSHSPSQSRPSVITCATLTDRKYEIGSNGSCSPSRKDTGINVTCSFQGPEKLIILPIFIPASQTSNKCWGSFNVIPVSNTMSCSCISVSQSHGWSLQLMSFREALLVLLSLNTGERCSFQENK